MTITSTHISATIQDKYIFSKDIKDHKENSQAQKGYLAIKGNEFVLVSKRSFLFNLTAIYQAATKLNHAGITPRRNFYVSFAQAFKCAQDISQGNEHKQLENHSVANTIERRRSEANVNLNTGQNINCLQLRRVQSGTGFKNELPVAPLFGVDQSNTYLYEKSSFKGKDLQRANFSKSEIHNCDFDSANLQWANFAKAYLIVDNYGFRNADLRWSSFNGARLRDIDGELIALGLGLGPFERANFGSADLRNTQWEYIDLVGANFSGAKLDGATIKLLFHTSERNLDRYLNHDANGYSLLMTITSIDDKYADLKRNLIHSLLDAIDKPGVINLSPYRNNFVCLLTPVFLGDERIKQFLTDKIIKQTIDHANSQPWTGVSKNACKAFLNYIESTKDFDLIANNGFFVQLILSSMSVNDKEVNEQAKALYEKYLSHPSIQPITQHDFFGSGDYKVDWSDLGEANNFVLLNAPYIMMIAKNDLASLLNPTVDTQWDRFFLFDEGYKDDKGNLITIADSNRPPSDQLFKTFRIFDSPYQFAQRKEPFIQLLGLLELGQYQQNFVSALQVKGLRKKMVDAKDQTALREIFGKVLKTTDSDNKPLALEDYRLRAEHYAQIERQFELTDCDPKIKAQTLFALAAVFAKYSSSNFFGTEGDSPEAVRYYAYALLCKAKELDSNITTNDEFEDWKNRLFGLHNAFTCTAILSKIMIDYARKAFPDVVNSILSPAWK